MPGDFTGPGAYFMMDMPGFPWEKLFTLTIIQGTGLED